MPARNKPPVAAVVVGVLIAAAIILVVSNRVVNLRPDDPAAGVARLSSADPVRQAIVLEQAGQHREAADVLRKHLDERPDDLDAFVVLWRVLPRDGRTEFGDRLTKCTRPEQVFTFLLTMTRDNYGGGDVAATAALFAGLKEVCPNDPRWVCEEIRQKVTNTQYAEATEQFRDHCPTTTDDGRAQFLRTWVEAMSSRERQVAAYAAVPDTHAGAAFFALACPLEYPVLAGEGGAEPEARLRALVEAHRRRSPDDPQGWYFEGVGLQAGGEYERAEKVYAAGQAKRPRPPPRRRPPTSGGRATGRGTTRRSGRGGSSACTSPAKAYSRTKPSARPCPPSRSRHNCSAAKKTLRR